MDNLEQHFLLDPNIIFLNHGSFGACPKPVFTTYQQWQRKLEDQPVLFLGRELSALRPTSSPGSGRLFPHRSGQPGIHPQCNPWCEYPSPGHSNFGPGDIVLTTDHEYGACDYTWEYICQHNRGNLPPAADPATGIYRHPRLWIPYGRLSPRRPKLFTSATSPHRPPYACQSRRYAPGRVIRAFLPLLMVLMHPGRWILIFPRLALIFTPVIATSGS